MKLILCLLLLTWNHAHGASAVIAEIERNIEKTKGRMKIAENRTSNLEDSIEKVQDNINNLRKSIGKNQGVKERSANLMSDYGSRLGEAEKARKDFLEAVGKDRKELALVRKDIVTAKKKLGALTAAEEALKESIEISEESLDKIANRRQKWGENRVNAKTDLQGVNHELIVLRRKSANQQKLLKENSAALKKWRKSYVQLAGSLQKLTLRLKKAKRGKK